MSVLSWNYRRISNRRTVPVLVDLVEVHKPNFVFICETQCKGSDVEYLKQKLKMNGLLTVDSVGQSGGLALLWNFERGVELLCLSRYCIDVEVNRLIGAIGD